MYLYWWNSFHWYWIITLNFHVCFPKLTHFHFALSQFDQSNQSNWITEWNPRWWWRLEWIKQTNIQKDFGELKFNIICVGGIDTLTNRDDISPSERKETKNTRKKKGGWTEIERKKKDGWGIIYHLIKYIREHDKNEHIGNVNFSWENASCLPNCNVMPSSICNVHTKHITGHLNLFLKDRGLKIFRMILDSIQFYSRYL